VSAEHVALIPQCAECLAVWLPDDEDRWLAYLDTDSELAEASTEWRPLRVRPYRLSGGRPEHRARPLV